MNHSSIVREIHIDASPEVVFAVVSDPAHVRQWWPDEANFEAVPTSTGEVVFTKDGERFAIAIEVVDAIPYSLFAFRWTQPTGERAREDNSFLVTFDLAAAGAGTLLRMTETGFDKQGWETSVVEATYLDHSTGWDYHLERLVPYAAIAQSMAAK